MASGHQGKNGAPILKVWYSKGTNDTLTRVRTFPGSKMIWALPNGPDGTWKEVPINERELRANLLDL